MLDENLRKQDKDVNNIPPTTKTKSPNLQPPKKPENARDHGISKQTKDNERAFNLR